MCIRDRLVSGRFDDVPVYLLDFKKHLKPEFALSKELINLPNGRPSMAIYTLEGIRYCTREWEFTDIEYAPGQKILQRKRVVLNYIRPNGSKSDDIVLENKTYDPTSLSDGALIYRDRVMARQTIVDEINAFINGVFAQGGLNDAQVAAMVRFVWNETIGERDDYVSLGTPDYAKYLDNAELTHPERQWLATPIAAGVTIADYIKQRISIT